ncbi:PREDICTED: NXPE family member 1-like [Branchiostoma belcheri]|uniref:NXPE family member 1-like n=1 Tax=Branchiostoma belcheri TaxID=7741 RepID=A0A6P4ZSV6_BRABE|nr:PREDICTED: NXPE family member 1-like [Branchiostoma belcheri]
MQLVPNSGPVVQSDAVLSRLWHHQQNGSVDYERVTKSENFVISVVNPRPWYRVGRHLSIKIVAMDTRGRPKTYGGDFIRAKVYSRSPVQASTSGKITYFGNGTYVANFFLSFPGELSVAVKLVHSSEAVQVLRRLQDISVVRRIMVCGFQEENSDVTEWMQCSNTPQQSLSLRDVCDFSKPRLNASFYCQRPRESSCKSFLGCHRDHVSTLEMHDKIATEEEKRLFPRDRDLLEEIPRNISLQVKGKRRLRKMQGKRLPLCGPRLPQTASEGYWFNGTWTSLRCQARRFRTIESVAGCLQNKTLYTLMKLLPLQPRNQMPLMNGNDMGYVAEELDGIAGGRDVVILLTLWAHFMAEPILTFRSRLYGIRHAIQRLHSLYPDTTVIWRTPNTGHHHQFQHFVENGDWYAYQLFDIVYEILGDLNISIINVRDMSESMWHDDDMHPPNDVIENHIDLVLSHICPV